MLKREDIIEAINNSEYEVFGIRADWDTNYNIGDIYNNSHQWWQDDPEDGSEYNENRGLWDGGELSGTCAIEVTADTVDEAMKLMKAYTGNRFYLLGGDYAEGGNDRGEIIIENAEVLVINEK